MFTKLSEHFEFRHFRPHYLDVDTIFGDLRRECLHQSVVRYTIFRKAPPSVVSGYGKRSINLSKVVATFEKVNSCCHFDFIVISLYHCYTLAL